MIFLIAGATEAIGSLIVQRLMERGDGSETPALNPKVGPS